MMRLRLKNEYGVLRIMNFVTNCPCCSSPMLHHLRNRQEYWFCRKCWQEMPNLSISSENQAFPQNRIINLSTNLIRHTEAVAV